MLARVGGIMEPLGPGFPPPRHETRCLREALVPKPMRHADAAALEGWLRTTWVPYTERIPETQRAEFLVELTGLVRENCDTAEDGTILLPMVNLEVEATRVAA